MTSESKLNGENPLEVGELCNKKPDGWTWPVVITHNGHQRTEELLVYPCNPSEKFIHPDSLSSAVVIQNGLQLKTLYALSRGPCRYSLVVLRYEYVSDDSMIFTITASIRNVFTEFLWEIKVPGEFEKTCTPPTSETSTSAE